MFALQNWRVNPFERALFNLSRGCCGGSTNGGGTRGNSLNLLYFWNALQIWVSTCCNLYLYLYLKCFCCAAFNCTLHVARCTLQMRQKTLKQSTNNKSCVCNLRDGNATTRRTTTARNQNQNPKESLKINGNGNGIEHRRV